MSEKKPDVRGRFELASQVSYPTQDGVYVSTTAWVFDTATGELKLIDVPQPAVEAAPILTAGKVIH